MTNGTAPASADAEPKTFSVDYVRELREENKSLRLAKQAAERERDGYRGAAETAAEAARAEADQRIIRAELKASAIKAGIIDPEALKLLDIAGMRLNQAGEVEGADELLTKFKEAKPHFFASTAAPSTSSTARTPPAKSASGRKASEMTNQEFAAALARIHRGLPVG